MKRLLFLVCSLVLSATVYADGTKTCQVKGTDGSVEVNVTVTDAENGVCILYFSNDTDKNVNVRYEVSCGYGYPISGAKLVYANSEGTKQVSFQRKVNAGKVRVQSLSGEKCN